MLVFSPRPSLTWWPAGGASSGSTGAAAAEREPGRGDRGGWLSPQAARGAVPSGSAGPCSLFSHVTVFKGFNKISEILHHSI